ncbi:protein of unknown function (plasmid) [Cupriavidus taiwanensis]|uniref:Transposase n=1 Tax=Cupriavidus taiwanensis TaxID=164546 RepID=A0A375ISL5_9BURK|nr:protein of unknown function [Cupriavidus taiwanensis]
MNTSVVEGINNTINGIKLRAYGYREEGVLVPQNPGGLRRAPR